tara:strand:- start:117 stop:362 length:246 start_codon:yes stop_codon:yes gene_type:complete
MEKAINYISGFFNGLVSIMISIVPVTILWQLLTGTLVFEMDIITNFVNLVNSIGGSGFTGFLALVFVMYFFLDCKKDCAKK